MGKREMVVGATSGLSRAIVAALAVAVLLSLGCCGRDGELFIVKPPPKEHDCARYSNNHPAWSPNDDYIIFAYHTDPFIHPDTLGLYRFDLRDSSCVKIVPGDILCPDDVDFSPDGRWIVFVWHYQLWKATVDGDSLTQLTFDVMHFDPAWSPDGSTIAYFRWTSGVNTMNPDGSGRQFIVKGLCPQWIDDHRIAYLDPMEGIFICDIDDGIGEQIFRVRDDWIEIMYLAYSRESLQLIFSVDEKKVCQTSLWRIDLDGGNLTPLVLRGGAHGGWSPDGTEIVYVDTHAGSIWVMAADGTNRRPLLDE